MKHLKLVVALVVFVALLTNVMFAAGPQNTKGRLALPQGVKEQPEKIAKKSSAAVEAPLFEASQISKSGKEVDRPVVLSKSGTIPPGFDVSGLSGTYHIGAAQPGGFKTINDMAFLMNIGALTGPVTFLLDDASYTEAGVAIGATSGSSATNTITIRPNTGNTACVITLTDNTTNDGGFVLSGVTYVTVNGTAVGEAAGSRNMTIQLSATPGASDGGDAPVRIVNSQNVSIANCKIPGNSSSNSVSNTTNYTTNGNASVKLQATSGFYNSHITIDNCELYNGHFGVQSRGNWVRNDTFYGVQDDNISVTNNYIHDLLRSGIELWQVSIANISGNVIKRIVIPSTSGVPSEIGYVLPADGSADPVVPNPGSRSNLPHITRPGGIIAWGDEITVSKNLIDSVYNMRVSGGTGSAQTYGIRVVGFGSMDPGATYGGGLSLGGVPTLSVVKNNIITRVHADNAVQANGQLWGAIGIGMDHGRFDTVVYNTIYHSGTNGTGSSAGMVINGVTETSGNSGLPDWFGDGSTAVSAFSYRVRVTNNIIAINRPGSGHAVLGIQSSGGVMDYRGGNNNVLFMGSSGNTMVRANKAVFPSLYDFQQYQIAGGFPTDGSSQADNPVLNSESDVNFSGLSTADETGAAFGSVTDDYAGTARVNPPDIGALEGTGTGLPHDVKPVSLVAPGAAGVPAGLPFSGFQAIFLNLGGFAETSFPVNIKITDPDATVHNFPGTATLAAGAAGTVSISGTWTPATAGTATVQITTALGTDDYTFNDTVNTTLPVAAQATVPYTSGFESAPEKAGWFSETSWGFGTTGGKLTGPRTGTQYYVTNPGTAGNGTVDATAQNLYSPFFDMTTAPSGTTLSFYLSLNTERSWDRMTVLYSIDTGATYSILGSLNDANGINWYSTAVYQNAAGTNAAPDCWDNATALAKNFPTPGTGATPPPGFTANGDCENDAPGADPAGYVLVALDLTGHPVMGKSFVRFKFSYFTDAGTHGDGMAIDDLVLGAGPSSTDAAFSGKIYLDGDGNASFGGGDVGLSGVQVYLTYFGAPKETTVTDINGDYSFTTPNAMYLPGVYDINTNYTSGAISQNSSAVNYAGTGIAATGKNQGYYDGSISGKKYDDVNDNGNNDSEPGLAGWTIELHADSANGALLQSTVTDGSGNYSFQVVPGTYGLKEVAQAVARQTEPAGGEGYDGIVVSGISGSGGANPSGYEFGNWYYGALRVNLTTDIDGDGVVDAGDVTALPAGASSDFVFSKNGSPLDTVTLGNTSSSFTFTSLDTGSYTITELTFPGGWLRTKGGTYPMVITTSNDKDTARYMDFKFLTVSGKKYHDLNGNGANDSEPNLAGWTINVSGNGLGSMSAVTDANGDWSVDSVTTGVHNITEVLQAGWTKTQPTGPNYSFTAISGNLPNPGASGNNFGNFQNVCISGVKYRDRNGDGDQDAGEEVLSGWTINLNPGGSSAVTDVNGEYSFCNLGPGTYTLTETAQPGWILTEPSGGSYVIAVTSGTNSTGNDFGNFKGTDSTAYRTFTADQLDNDSEKKPVKKPKAGKPILSGPNTGNLLADIIGQGGVLKVGLSGQLNAGGKEKGYLNPAKQGDVFKTFNVKSVGHTGVARGFDTDAKGKLMLKRFKSIPYTKKNSTLIANLLALQINLVASGLKTPAGLGGLLYNDPGHALHGMSIDQIADYADTVMTNWEGVPYSVYVMLDSVAAKINAAFATGSVSDTTATGGWTSLKLQWVAVTTVIDVPFLKASGNPAKNRITGDVINNVPTSYALEQNFPNPFNPTTTIRFDLPEQAKVTLKIYNMLGQEVATVLDNEEFGAEEVEFEFDASSLSSGVYLYRLVADAVNDDGVVTGSQTFTQVKKMVLVK